MQHGDIVTYREPVDDEEARMRFVVVESRGDRALIRLLDAPNPLLPPTECVPTDALVMVLAC